MCVCVTQIYQSNIIIVVIIITNIIEMFIYRYKFFVFSAYYEWRGGVRAVRIIGATKTRGPERVWCRLWQPGNSTSSASSINTAHLQSVSVPGKVKVYVL